MEFRRIFDTIPDQFDRWRPRYCAQAFADIAQEAHLGPGAAALEIGPGTGQATEPILRTGCEYLGVELGEHLAARMREKFADAPNFSLVCGDFLEQDLGAERFDLVLSAATIQWMDEKDAFPRCYALLKPGGVFLTQQVGGQNDNDLSRALIPGFVPQYPRHTLANNRRLLEESGLVIREAKEHFSPIRFFDVGALVYFAKILPWEFPGFTVDGCLETLFRLEEQRRRDGFVQGTEHRFLLRAEKP